MDPQPHDPSIEIKTAEAQLAKLDLEISSLKWQNSILGRLNQLVTIITIFATIVTVGATLFGVWQGYEKFITDKQKENELRAKELTERTASQYRVELQQILQYPIDEKQTIPVAVFLLRDLQNIIENGYQGEELERHRNEVGFLLDQLIRSPQFDFNKARNVEFDRKAIIYCDYYSTFLRKQPDSDMDIISSYKSALLFQHYNESPYYQSIYYQDDLFKADKPPKDEGKRNQFELLFLAYKEHIKLLKGSLEEKTLNPQDISNKLKLALCWYYGATLNKSLTKNIFDVDDKALQVQLEQCPS